jgi:hypothetical protein
MYQNTGTDAPSDLSDVKTRLLLLHRQQGRHKAVPRAVGVLGREEERMGGPGGISARSARVTSLWRVERSAMTYSQRMGAESGVNSTFPRIAWLH